MSSVVKGWPSSMSSATTTRDGEMKVVGTGFSSAWSEAVHTVAAWKGDRSWKRDPLQITEQLNCNKLGKSSGLKIAHSKRDVWGSYCILLPWFYSPLGTHFWPLLKAACLSGTVQLPSTTTFLFFDLSLSPQQMPVRSWTPVLNLVSAIYVTHAGTSCILTETLSNPCGKES